MPLKAEVSCCGLSSTSHTKQIKNAKGATTSIEKQSIDPHTWNIQTHFPSVEDTKTKPFKVVLKGTKNAFKQTVRLLKGIFH
jgi:hypothetical protein